MIPGINPKQMQAMMKQMGINQTEINSSRVIIEKEDGNRIIIENPAVVKIKMQGQESFQITGEVREEELGAYSDQDIETIIEKTGCTKEQAQKALEKTGDLAEAILSFSN